MFVASCMLKSMPHVMTAGRGSVQEYNDAMLTVFMTSITKGAHSVNEIVDKVASHAYCRW